MSLELLKFAPSTVSPRARTQALIAGVVEGRAATTELFLRLGVLVRDVEDCLEPYENAHIAQVLYLEGRAERAEARVNRILALDLPGDLRRVIYDATARRPFQRISDADRELLAMYRRMPDLARRAIRALCRQLSGEGVATPEAS